MNNLITKSKYEATKFAIDMRGSINKINLKARQLSLMLLTFVASSRVVFAGGDTSEATAVFENIIEQVRAIYPKLATLAGVILVCALVICGLIWGVSKNQKHSDAAFEWGKRIVIAAIVVICAPGLLIWATKLVTGAFDSNKLSDVETLFGTE